MLKLALAAAMSMLLVLEPTVAEAKTRRHHAVKRSTAQVAVLAKIKPDNNGDQLVRRVVKVHGKRRVVYERVRRAAPVAVAAAALSAGELAGLNRIQDSLGLRSNVAFVMDQQTSEVLYDRNSTVALPIASITKLMTGLLVVQSQLNLDDVLAITDDDVDHLKFSSSRLPVGTRMTRGNLLHIALMSSENRAASALGRNYPGGREAFVAAMNAKAHELGMNDTHYVDSNGLSSQNVSSARDLAKLVMIAHQEPLLRQYTTDPSYVVQANGRQMQYHNTNYLVAMPDWNIGLQKTGFINEAGRCLVMQATIQGRNVIMVFLDSKGKMSRTADAGRMRKWLEAIKPPTIPASAAGGVPVTVSAATAAPLVH
ncbi:D-alanyl-D-alanine endopeptidase [Massilia sp. 9096]|uniref:D-alanyl-D-alanine endopeptidase n=1 Tax=Massilia sp. 9096 TaxID=1500894 RepID=UPI00068C1D13|nr:D-alanyl-D-alanine endopeptidase [Massilia sp. 9096]